MRGFSTVFGAALAVGVLAGCGAIPDRAYNALECKELPCPSGVLDLAIRQVDSATINGFGRKSRISDFGPPVACADPFPRPSQVARHRLTLPFCRAFLEYQTDERPGLPGPGGKWDPNQLAAILRFVEGSETPLLVVVYVHGWHNNADRAGSLKKRDLAANSVKFDDMLVRHAYELAHLGTFVPELKNHRVLGVYVGWRGAALSAPILPYLTLPQRAAAADRLGRGELAADLLAISETMRARRDHDNRSINRMLVYGHSLGGRALVRAFAPRIARAPNQSPLGDGVLITTINPAIGSDSFDGLFAPGNTATSLSESPYMINVTSRDDWTTGSFGILNRLGYLRSDSSTSPRRNYAIGHGPDDDQDAGRDFGSHVITHLGFAARYMLEDERLARMGQLEGGFEGAIERLRSKVAMQFPRDSAISLFESEVKPRRGEFSLALPCRMMGDAATMVQLGLEPLPAMANDRCVSKWASAAARPGEFSAAVAFHSLEFPARTNTFNETRFSATFYRISMRTLARPQYPAMGKVWTIRTDDSVLDFGVSAAGTTGVHNGYIQTMLVRLLAETLFDDLISARILPLNER
jgi:hypothetical protein